MTKPEQPAGLTLELVREAHERIKDKVTRTPLMTSATLDGSASRVRRTASSSSVAAVTSR